MSPRRAQPPLHSNAGAEISEPSVKEGSSVAGIPEPEPRGYAGNLGVLISDYATSGRTAIVDLYNASEPRDLTFRELDRLCNAVARGLRNAGLQPGDRIAILSLNRHEFIGTLLGAMRAGVVPVPINIKLAAETVHYI